MKKNTQKSNKRKNQTRYGVFYRSNGRWVGPYQGRTFTEYTINREPIKSDIRWFANHLLKSRIKIQSVS